MVRKADEGRGGCPFEGGLLYDGYGGRHQRGYATAEVGLDRRFGTHGRGRSCLPPARVDRWLIADLDAAVLPVADIALVFRGWIGWRGQRIAGGHDEHGGRDVVKYVPKRFRQLRGANGGFDLAHGVDGEQVPVRVGNRLGGVEVAHVSQ